ncbi:S8 family serine peptidase [Lederbergia sp. NSJ-179]|uniref:S8 family serine peptidase n=1 Tax=Lederbergia sp. NSJ-179 TaxID=2931402 RepID=UPI001FD57125|nr:S8 family serine peptidase [Lederbergia sp. NSJ-179]MCJ7841351.1 S8 family serine peptidase [Lederbergia sp. NSJ-179]
MFKRIGIFLLIFLMAFSNVTFAKMGDITPQKVTKELHKRTELVPDKLTETVDPNKKVRVIIEMKEEAPIEIATKKGVMFKSFSKAEKKKLHNKARSKQKAVKSEIENKKIKPKYLQEFDTVVNGFSAEIKQKDINGIKEIPDVKAVYVVNEYERPIAEPDMKYSKELVEAQQAWRDYGVKGEGMVVGIIDSGIDPSHRDMVLTDNSTAKLTEQSVAEKVSNEALPGKFYTEKVPYGYNYMDENNEIREIYREAGMHGMHVAGTVGANGDEDNGGIKGVAPEAQLLALKVFGNDPEMQSTYGDIYIKAIDDAIKLEADVLNMSLGSPAGSVDPESPEQQAVKRAVDNGIFMAISAGNANMFADGYYYPMASNPDYGISGSPGLAYDATQVASYENSFIEVDEVEYSIDGETAEAPFLSAGKTSPAKGKTYELVEAGLGAPEDFEGKDIEGKYALVQRGELDFTAKALNAQGAGAAGIFIYNNTDGIVNMASDDAIKIPHLFMLKSDGDKLAEALENGKDVSITFNGEKIGTPNPDAEKMSEFSSWGLTPNLDFKPEITAPGGQILSTLNDDQYGIKSGTSMAAPHIAGGAALVFERIEDEFGLENADRVNRAKNIMMNTAKVVDLNGAFVSPRRQGAGLMQLHAALSTPVMVTESKTNEAKVALKEIKDDQVTFELTATNFTDEAVSYDVQANAQTDAPVQNGSDLIVVPNQFGALDLTDAGYATAAVNGKAVSTVEVPANGSVTLSITVDLGEYDETLKEAFFENGYWLEGFVTLTDPTDSNPELSVPYVGFMGDWDQAPIFDRPMWDSDTYYGMTGVVTPIGEEDYGFLGEDLNTGAIDPAKIAFSPNGDSIQDKAIIILSFLRNAKDVKFNVLDENKKIVRKITTEDYIRKNYYDGGRAPMYSLSSSRAWDGKVNGKLAKDGQYYLQVEAAVDFDGAKRQSTEIPVLLDTTAPELEASFDAKKNKVLVSAADAGSGVAYWDVLVDGKSVLDKPYTNGETEHKLADAPSADQKLTVVAVDYAGNQVEKEAVEVDTTVPDLHLLTPENLGVETDRAVVFSGYVSDESGVKEVTIDGQKAELVYDEEKDRYDFSLTIKHKQDDFYFYHIKAVDNAGNETEIGRRFFLDSEKAKIKVKAKKKVKTDTVKVSVDIKDNFDDIRLYVNGNEEFKQDLSSPYGMKGFNKTIDLELALEDGKNEFEFEVVDLGSHSTTERVTIEKQVKNKGHDHGSVGSIISIIHGIIGIIWGWFN